MATRFDPLDLFVISQERVDSVATAGEHIHLIEDLVVRMLTENHGSVEHALEEYGYRDSERLTNTFAQVGQVRGAEVFCDAICDAMYTEEYIHFTIGITNDSRQLHYIESDNEQMGYFYIDGHEAPLMGTCQGEVWLIDDAFLASEHGCTHPDMLGLGLQCLMYDEQATRHVSLGDWIDNWYCERPLTPNDLYFMYFAMDLARYRPERFPRHLSPMVEIEFVVECDATAYGDEVALVFGPEWDIYASFELDGEDFPTWRGRRHFPRGLDIEFKTVILRTRRDGALERHLDIAYDRRDSTPRFIDWESGENRTVVDPREGDVVTLAARSFSLA